jgi:bifunctional non-homologous end joining protein LigD
VDGILVSDSERGEIRPELFRHACLLSLEGLLSKQICATAPGRSPHWVKVKNPKSPAMLRAKDAFS